MGIPDVILTTRRGPATWGRQGGGVYQNSDLRIFSGNAHQDLASDVCRYLDIEPGDVEVFQFSNENIFVRFQENIRGRDVFLIQPFSSPVNQNIMELLIMIDAAKRASAGRVTAVVPYFAYGRTDKKDQPRVPITGRLLADLIQVAGAERVLTIDLHAGQIQGFFSVPVDELTATPLIADYFLDSNAAGVVVAPDVGSTKRARDVAERWGEPLAIVEKRRFGNSGRSESVTVIGDVKGRKAIIVDDEVDTGGSLVSAAETSAGTRRHQRVGRGYSPDPLCRAGGTPPEQRLSTRLWCQTRCPSTTGIRTG